MEMADLPVAVGPKMAEKLSVSLSCQWEEVFELTPVILCEFADVTRKPGDRKKMYPAWSQDMTTPGIFLQRKT